MQGGGHRIDPERVARLRGARVRARPIRLRHAETAKELEHVLVEIAGTAAGCASALGGADVDDRRADLLDQIGKVR